jgi:hypothetical protein
VQIIVQPLPFVTPEKTKWLRVGCMGAKPTRSLPRGLVPSHTRGAAHCKRTRRATVPWEDCDLGPRCYARPIAGRQLGAMPKERTRRYSIEIKDATGRSVWFAAADWTDDERRIAIAQTSRLCGMPDENCFTEAAKPTKPAKN